MTTHYLHSGGLGDVIYALPYIRHHGGGVLHLKSWNPVNFTTIDAFRMLKPLLLQQEYIEDAIEYDSSLPFGQYDPAVNIDVDLDGFRAVADFEKTLPTTYFLARGEPVPPDWSRPWLTSPRAIGTVERMADAVRKTSYALVHRTDRYRDPAFDWRPVLAQAADAHHGRVFFIGYPVEYFQFRRDTGCELRFLRTADLAEVARLIMGAEALYCNQSVSLTLAQGLGTPYRLEVAPGFSSCILNRPNERLLNR
jgi:hypothetical protein